MQQMEATALKLLASAQVERKAKLYAGLVDTVFKGGDLLQLLNKALSRRSLDR